MWHANVNLVILGFFPSTFFKKLMFFTANGNFI